jgi:thiamine-phosphate pyrophosphorylase
MRLVLPRLYVILDAALLTQSEISTAQNLAAAGVRLLQYRNKQASARELLEKSQALAAELLPSGVTFIVNDRPDVAALAGAGGVHLGQDDLGVEAARSLMEQNSIIGISTHNEAQFRAAVSSSADYLAIGPVFETSSKHNADPVVGLETLRAVRRLTDKPIVAIGGITLERAPEVIAAGANSVAVISDILRAADPAERARQYIDSLERSNHAAAV